jgi:methylenetetrahydrofolate reductase (NADPH)
LTITVTTIVQRSEHQDRVERPSDVPRAAAQSALIASARLEVLPLESVESQLAALPFGSQVTVTCSPRHGVDRTLAFAERWSRRGLRVVPHIAARQVEDVAHAARIAARVARLGSSEAFVIGGDRSPPLGRYGSAVELLRDLAPRLPDIAIGVAGYPEGHPLIAAADLAAALAAKQDVADAVVTQLCFDPARTCAFIRTIRRAGVAAPVLVGVPGVVDRRRLFELSRRIGVGASLGFMRKNLRVASHLAARPYHPHDLVARLDELRRAEPELGIAGLHLFTFNQVSATQTWLEAARSEEQRAP